MLQLLGIGRKLLLAGLAAPLALIAMNANALEVGDKAPDFSLPGSDGNTYTLSQYIGEKPVVISFFPKAFTGG
jgi:peroxiredoxin Q/BCP